MRRSTVAAATACLASLLAACSSPAAEVASPSPTSEVPSPMVSATISPQDSPRATASPNSAVERYCRGVDAFIAESKKALRQPAKADTEELQQMAADLSQQAQALTSELIENPELTERVKECTRKLNEFNPERPQG